MMFVLSEICQGAWYIAGTALAVAVTFVVGVAGLAMGMHIWMSRT